MALLSNSAVKGNDLHENVTLSSTLYLNLLGKNLGYFHAAQIKFPERSVLDQIRLFNALLGLRWREATEGTVGKFTVAYTLLVNTVRSLI